MLIYIIKNKINGEAYIGQTTKETFKERYDGTGRWWKSTRNKHLKNAALYYGTVNFEVTILHDNIDSEEELNRLEIEYIKTYNTLHPSGYNYQAGGQLTRNRGHHDITAKRICESNGKRTWRLLNNTDMKIYEFTNISRFAKSMNLSGPLIIHILSGKRRSKHKRWTLVENPIKRFEICHEDGRKLEIFDGEIKKFCRENGIGSTERFFYLLNGRLAIVKGWKLVRAYLPDTIDLEVIILRQYDMG